MRTRRSPLSSIRLMLRDLGVGHLVLGARRLQQAGVDLVDDLHVARQQPLEERHRPALQRLGQERVVGVADAVPRVSSQASSNSSSWIVHQEPHQLGDADRRVGVVELDRHLVGEVVEAAVLLHVPAQDVLERGGGEEILLPQAQLLPGRRGVGGIEHAGQRVGAVALGEAAGVVAGVEGVEPDRVDRVGLPEPERVHPRRRASRRSACRRRWPSPARPACQTKRSSAPFGSWYSTEPPKPMS